MKMNSITYNLTLIVIALTLSAVVEASEVLMGTIDDSPRWGSGWLELNGPRDFSQGDKLVLSIGGSAKKIKVRLLPRGSDPNSRAGMLPGVYKVPEDNRVVVIELQANRASIVQISVHGGPNPWGKYPLGGDNGPATLEQVVVTEKK